MKKADNKNQNRNLSWKILDETTVIKDSWIDMRASTCQLPGGMVIAPFYVNHLPDFAVVVAVTPEHRVILVRQYRHGVEKVLLELPAGCIEAGEDPREGAARELSEETGYKAGSLEFLFKIAPNASNCTSYAQCYLARDVYFAAAQNLDETESLEVVEMDGEEVKRLLREGGFEQAVHVAALYRAVELGALG
ncbi:MAG: NUDIX hydrolase [Clostridia bacterium]|nr:NUDIX hydrolase [Clostridia bacterium]